MSIWSRIEQRLTNFADEILPDEYKDQLEGGYKLLERGRPSEALRIASRLLKLRPGNAEASGLQGEAQLTLRDFEAARDAFASALKEKPGKTDAQIGMGRALSALKRWEEAEEVLRKASLSPAQAEVRALAYRELGRVHLEQGAFDKAIRELRKAAAENPEDLVVRALLGRVLATRPSPAENEAQAQLRLALDGGLEGPQIHLAMGKIFRRKGEFNEAVQSFKNSLDTAEDDDTVLAASLGITATLLALEELEQANKALDRAVATAPEGVKDNIKIATLFEQLGKKQDAFALFAKYSHSDKEACERALQLSLELNDWNNASTLAEQLEKQDPTNGKIPLARALIFARTDRTEDGLKELSKCHEITAWEKSMAHANLLLSSAINGEKLREALETARTASDEAPASPGVSEVLMRASKLSFPSTPQASLESIHNRLSVALLDFPEVRTESSLAQHAVSLLDAPLSIAILGEFSSGKSSFINAVVGQKVAATGVLPTTATINVVKYGRKQSGRICWTDGRTESIPWEELFERIASLGEDEAKRIDVVEILLPRDDLQHINFVDTPGLNSIQAEHELTTQNFIQRADAIVWLFSAGQAGKASEKKALKTLKNAGKPIVGVMNKMDLLNQEESEEALRFLKEELGNLVDTVVPFSAVLASSESGKGNKDLLMEELDRRFSAKAQELKAGACRRALSGLVGAFQAALDKQKHNLNSEQQALLNMRNKIESWHTSKSEVSIADCRKAILDGIAKLYEASAQEVLELVQPRRIPFGSHNTTVADRDYLLAILDDGYQELLAKAKAYFRPLLRHSIQREPSSEIAPKTSVEIQHLLDEQLYLLDAEVIGSTASYLRGFLRGGYVDGFFRNDLPKLELSRDNVYHALFRGAPNLDKRLSTHFSDLVGRSVDRVKTLLTKAEQRIELQLRSYEEGMQPMLEQAKSDIETAQ